MSLDAILSVSGIAGEAVVFGLLLYRRAWRAFPVFSAYILWDLLSSISAYAIYWSHSKSSVYITFYLADVIVDSALLFGVIVELGWSIIRPLRSSLPRIAPLVVGLLILALGAIIWPFASVHAASAISAKLVTIMRLQQTFYILRVVVFLALAAFSQMLSIGWRSRELQIATGLGFTSMVSLAVAMFRSYHLTRAEFYRLNELVVASFICSLVYWIVSFSRKEEERRKLSPQMQNVLLAMAGTARSTRIAISEADAGKHPKQGEL